MAALTNHVTITITADSVGVARAGFGVPLIISHNASWSGNLVRTYNTFAEVVVDFAVTTSPEYLCAQALFGQSPHPTVVKIAKAPLQPTQKYTVVVDTAANDTVYTINVKGEGVTATAATMTSDATATKTEITAGLKTALDAVVGKNFAVVDDTIDTLTITGDAAGDWFSLEVAAANISQMTVEQTHADPGIATDLAAIFLEDADWYFLLTLYNSNALVLAAAAFANTNKRIYVADVNETDAINTAVGNSDTLDDLKTAAYQWVTGWYHPSPADFVAASITGRMAPLEPGAGTWKFKGLTGPAPVVMTATQRANLTGRGANSYETVAGVNITFEGTTAQWTTAIPKFIDSRRGIDWLDDDMSKGVFGLLQGNDKVPFTNAGIAMVEGEVRASLDRAERKGIIDSGWTVTVPDISEVSAADKASRTLPDVKFEATEAGAIHKNNITGVVSV